MIDYQVHLQVTITTEGHLNISVLKERTLMHDASIKIGGDAFANAKKLLFIFESFHLHLYYNIDITDIARFEIMNPIERQLEPNIEFTCENKELNSSFLLFIDTLATSIERLIYKWFKSEALIAVLSSDIHGDLIQFLLPLRLTNNLLINRCRDGVVSAIMNKGLLCIFDGDYYTQNVDFFAKRLKLNNSAIIQTELNERILDFIHSFVDSTINILILMTYLHRTNVYFNIGNHDSRLLKEVDVKYRLYDAYSFKHVDHSLIRRNLNILILFSMKDRIYLIQHGLINMSLYYFNKNGYQATFDEEILNIVYDVRKIRYITNSSIYRLHSITYESIEHEISKLDTSYIRVKIEAEMNKQAHSERHLDSMKKTLTKEPIEPITLLNIYHSKSSFDMRLLDSFIKHFYYNICHNNSINAYIILGHSYNLSGLPFQSKYEIYKQDAQLMNEITKENVIYKNVLTLDTESNSFANEFVRDECMSKKIGGKDESHLIIFLFISSLIICIIYIISQLNVKKIGSFIYTTIAHT